MNTRSFIAGFVFAGLLFGAASRADDVARIIKDATGLVRIGSLAAGEDAVGTAHILKTDNLGRIICSPEER